MLSKNWIAVCTPLQIPLFGDDCVVKHEARALMLIVLQCFFGPIFSHRKLFITKNEAQFLHFLAVFWAKIMCYSLYRWLQKLKDRKNRPWKFKFKGTLESPKALFSESICGEKDRREMFILFISFLSFGRQTAVLAIATSSLIAARFIGWHVTTSMKTLLTVYYFGSSSPSPSAQRK